MSPTRSSFHFDRMGFYLDHVTAFRVNLEETLFVSGFWRSGTTWLQQALARLLGAKTVFEPLHFQAPAARELYANQQVLSKTDSFLELYLPFCAEPTLGDGTVLYKLFYGALRSDLRGKEIRLLREGLLESLRNCVVVKSVRSQLCLRAVQNTFSVPVIHVYRDPRAVLASIQMTDWAWLFDELSLRKQLLEPDDGRAGFFGQWADEILEADRSGRTAQITTYWALTERFVQHSHVDRASRIVFVSYEDLCLRREELFGEVLGKLGVSRFSADSSVMSEDSFSTAADRRGISIEERVTSWKGTLSSCDVSIVEAIASRFDFESRLYEPTS